mmetsp:Transcript_66910/g.160212  ORF Transcript_66910/g.160212 Transcript_66910/m.160212 type:complete len:294 (-) Transcript_66910:1474-2355(-)
MSQLDAVGSPGGSASCHLAAGHSLPVLVGCIQIPVLLNRKQTSLPAATPGRSICLFGLTLCLPFQHLLGLEQKYWLKGRTVDTHDLAFAQHAWSGAVIEPHRHPELTLMPCRSQHLVVNIGNWKSSNFQNLHPHHSHQGPTLPHPQLQPHPLHHPLHLPLRRCHHTCQSPQGGKHAKCRHRHLRRHQCGTPIGHRPSFGRLSSGASPLDEALGRCPTSSHHTRNSNHQTSESCKRERIRPKEVHSVGSLALGADSGRTRYPQTPSPTPAVSEAPLPRTQLVAASQGTQHCHPR